MKDKNSIHWAVKGAKLALFSKAAFKADRLPVKKVEIREKEFDEGNEKIKIQYAFDSCIEGVDDDTIEELSKTMFSLANAYPYLFDAVCGILTNRNKLSQKYNSQIIKFIDIKEALSYLIDIPFSEFLNWALDGEITQKERLIKNLNELAAKPPKELQKYIPISQEYCAKIAPIQIVLIRKKEKTISEAKLNSLKNLTRGINKETTSEKTIRLPIERIQIHPLKLLFQDLLIGKCGKRWFQTPKALQAKIVAFHPEFLERVSKELERLQNGEKTESEKEDCEKLEKMKKNFPSPMVLRKAYFYLKIHKSSNKFAKKSNLNITDFFTHVDPSYLRENRYGKKYIAGSIEGVKIFIETVINFFLALENKYNFSGEHLKQPLIKKG
jgi:hypothetical protein